MTPLSKQGSGIVSDDKPHLSISAHVVVQLGEELVTDVEQALLELSKNAYDADSEECEISIDPNWRIESNDPQYDLLNPSIDSESREPITVGRIQIRDYGTGIRQTDVENGWLRISSSLKRADRGSPKSKTAKGRTPVGDKGLGRLATMKLGRVLRMKTAVDGESEWRTVAFSWDDFTQDRTLEQVQVYTGTSTEPKTECKGTIIEILGLKNSAEWTNPSYIETHLVPNLSSLVHPFDIADRFEITVRSSGRIFDLHSLSDEVLNLASAQFMFAWDGKQLTQTAYIAPSLFRGARGDAGHSKYSELFGEKLLPKLISWLKEDKRLQGRGISFDVEPPWLCKVKDVLPGVPFPSDKAYPGAIDPGPFHASLYYFLFNDETKKSLTQAKVSATTLQAMSQVAIYRDGFRVRANRDWLRLSEGTTKGSSFYGLRPNNVIGHFSITNEGNPALVEKSDREGFVDNEALRGFMALGLRARDYANGSLEAIRASVNRFSNKNALGVEKLERKALARSIVDSRGRTESTLARIEADLEKTKLVLERLDSQVAHQGSDTDSAVTLTKTIESVKKALHNVNLEVSQQAIASQAIAAISDQDREYASRLLDAAAVGLAARSLAHELHQFVRQFRQGVDRIAVVNRKLKDPIIASSAKDLNSSIRELGKIVSTIDPMLPGTRSVKELIDIEAFLREYVEARRSAAAKADVVLELGVEDHPPMILFNRSRLLQIVENLFQNSLYWLRVGPVADSGPRRIDIVATNVGFRWHDNGPGIRASLESSIFDAYVSDKPSSEGSGLGLHIVSTFLEMERATIRVVGERNSLGRRSTFEINLIGASNAQHKLI